jgi:ADP-ribosyl-[dinitrogen reductase] hydrolase
MIDTKIQRVIDSSLPHPLTFGAIGDAYGFCFEFVDNPRNDLRYHQHPTFTNNKPGVYSDDTQMQIALAEVIASEREWTPHELAEAFVDTFKRDPRPGYAHRFQEFLTSIRSGKEFLEKMRPDSERNGAAMRAPVIGLFSSLDDVKTKSAVQARLTHDTRGGVDSAIAAALMSHFFAYSLGAKEELPDFLAKHVPGYDWSPTWREPVPVHGIKTVQAAVTAVCQSNSLSELLRRCVAFTGDVDSVATIAMASASSHASFTRDIPENLWNEFEPTQFGIDYLIDLDRRARAIAYKVAKVAPQGS